MFTGIIEEIGEIKSFTHNSNGATIVVKCKDVLADTKLGDSIAINGCCQTVVDIKEDFFSARVSDETLNITNFTSLKSGDTVNLERALTLNSRLGGHIVSGHVDCVGKLIKKEQLTDFYNFDFEIPQNQEKYIVYKGSITVSGISLTVANIDKNIFRVAVIPHTYLNTNLQDLKTGDFVNIETDILGKYVEKLLSAKDNNSRISLEFLQKNGFV